MADSLTSMLRALVAASLLLAMATVMLVTVNHARAAGALAVGSCGAYGEAFDYASSGAASRSALAKCQAQGCRVVTTVRHGCAAFAVDYTNACGGFGWGRADKLGRAQNAALKACSKEGGKECVIRTFFCDAKG